MPYMPSPTPPSRNRPATFSDEGDAFMAWLPPFNDYLEEVRLTSVDAIAASAVSVNASSIAIASANFKGAWASLSGALNMPASVSHSGAFWMLTENLANVSTAAPGVSASWEPIKTLPPAYAYASRSSLRALAPTAGDFVLAQGLGLFLWVAGSAQLDDDETVFSTASGAWILVAADPDYVHAVTEALQDDVDELQEGVDELQEGVDDLQNGVEELQAGVGELQTASDNNALAAAAAHDAANALAARLLRATFSMTLTSLLNAASSAFTVTVTGAALGDAVIVNPGNSFGTTTADQGRLSCVGHVSAANTVTVSVRNASGGTATMTASTWAVLVIKQ